MHNPIPGGDLIEERPWIVNDINNVLSEYYPMVVYTCKNCGELNYLTPHGFWNITNFGAKCEKCETINTITLEKGELRKQV
jgi:hypothetical protein